MNRERLEYLKAGGPTLINFDEEWDELCDLALRATDPEMVMVPRERLETWKSQGGIVGHRIHGFLTAYDEDKQEQQEMEEQE